MAIPKKKYLYRDTLEVFKKIDIIKWKYIDQKFTTRDAISYLIERGYQAEQEDDAKLKRDYISTEGAGL